VDWALYPRDIAMDDGLKLHGIEVPPLPFFPVVIDGTWISAFRTKSFFSH